MNCAKGYKNLICRSLTLLGYMLFCPLCSKLEQLQYESEQSKNKLYFCNNKGLFQKMP